MHPLEEANPDASFRLPNAIPGFGILLDAFFEVYVAWVKVFGGSKAPCSAQQVDVDGAGLEHKRWSFLGSNFGAQALLPVWKFWVP